MGDKDKIEESQTSLNRMAKIPVIETTLSKASEMYGKLKDASETVNSVLTTAENVVRRASETVQPVTSKLEGPMKKVDSVLCSGLDYVEEKVPAIKLPPHELAEATKNALTTNVVAPALKGAISIGEYGKEKLASITAHQAENSEDNKKK